jgi:DNA-binding MarR family transcriptional regulator
MQLHDSRSEVVAMEEAPSAAVGPDGRPSEDVREVADSFVVLVRAFNRLRARFLAAAAHDVEWSGHVVLKCVANGGPMRTSDIAECVHSDPSTVSRQVSGLVKDGLLERRADPEDGRASLLVVTDRARAVLADHDEIRVQQFARMLQDWNERDLHRFATLLRRFTTDFERSSETASPLGGRTTSRPDAPPGGTQ